MLAEIWPLANINELVTRLMLATSGSAFQKLSLHKDELLNNQKSSGKKVIELLGGFCGQIGLEKKYEAAERALFRSTQKQDESNDSYLARTDVAWSELPLPI